VANECSKPSATQAVIGGTFAATLLATAQALKQSQTTIQAKTLHGIPSDSA